MFSIGTLRSNDAVLDSANGRFGAIVDAKFVVGVAQMLADGTGTDEQFLGRSGSSGKETTVVYHDR